MTWIQTVAQEEATGSLRKLYDRVRGANGQIDQILQAHSLRPASLKGHLTLYKNVLHHTENQLPHWFREAIGVYVSHLNRCAYCVAHHYEDMKRLIADEARAERVLTALETGRLDPVFEKKQVLLLNYASLLTTDPTRVSEDLIDELRRLGWCDGEILEANQIVAYFCYANRTVLGLGVTLDGEVLGLAPSESAEDSWTHH